MLTQKSVNDLTQQRVDGDVSRIARFDTQEFSRSLDVRLRTGDGGQFAAPW